MISTEKEIDNLIDAMTLEEKAGQLTILPAALTGESAGAANPHSVNLAAGAQEQRVRDGTLGALFNSDDPSWLRRLQLIATRESRLKIPMLFAADVIHGFRTVFPVPLAEAASFDPALAERTARAAADEATAIGLHWNFAPMVDISRDARWGRGVEGSGEDVLLGQRLAAARVRGFQGQDISSPDAMAATLKHFAAYGASECGLDYNVVDISERTLREVYFPPFQAGIAAGARCVMVSFNEINGLPSHGNPWLLREVLRNEWGFDGVVVSDYSGDQELVAHGIARDDREAARIAISAGIDVSMASDLYVRHLPSLIQAGDVRMSVVDDAVRRVLRLKAELGLFKDPMARHSRCKTDAAERVPYVPLAREAATASVVMLTNDGVLPLRSEGARVALIGPFADEVNHSDGPWAFFGRPQRTSSLAVAIREFVSRDLTVVSGSGVERALPGELEKAVAAASLADVVILALGESGIMSGEANSRSSVTIPACQQALAEAIATTGKPMVILLNTGRALALEGAVKNASAILITWFLGVEMGNAIADILLGLASPKGRLPVSFPRTTGQQPFYYARRSTGRPGAPGGSEPFKARFREVDNTALFPFGHGLSYSDVEYVSMSITDNASLHWHGSIQIVATIRNLGVRTVDEVVQLYAHQRAASVTRPIRELIDWKIITLMAGQCADVVFDIAPSMLQFVDSEMNWRVEPGLFDIWVGPNSEAGLQGEFELRRAP